MKNKQQLVTIKYSSCNGNRLIHWDFLHVMHEIRLMQLLANLSNYVKAICLIDMDKDIP